MHIRAVALVNEGNEISIRNFGVRPGNSDVIRAVTALAISSDGKVLYAATEGEGVFRLGEIELDFAYLPVVLR